MKKLSDTEAKLKKKALLIRKSLCKSPVMVFANQTIAEYVKRKRIPYRWGRVERERERFWFCMYDSGFKSFIY